MKVKTVNDVLSFTISSSPRGEQSHLTDTVMMLVCVCKQVVITKADRLYTLLWCDPVSLSLSLSHSLSSHCDVDMWGRVWMSPFREVWQSLNFDKESLWFWDFSLCNFRDLICAQPACNTPKRKANLKLHHMTLLKGAIRLPYFLVNQKHTELPL